MINSFRRTGDGEADGGRGSGRGTGKRTEAAAAVRAVRLFGRRRLSSPAWPAASGAKPPPQQEPAAFFFLCCCFCRCRLSAAAAGSHPTDDGKIHRLVQQKRPQVVQLVGLQQPDGRIHRTRHVQVAQQPDGRIHQPFKTLFSWTRPQG